MSKNIGFISFRISGTDGVSLETRKWADVLTRMGCECYYMAGELDTPQNRSYASDSFHFKNPAIREIHDLAFSNLVRPSALTSRIHEFRRKIKTEIYSFVDQYDIDLIIAENSLSLPLNIPLGMALAEFIAETGMMTIAHHHDFFWERKRFLHNCVWDHLNSCYPPQMKQVKHVVINTSAQHQLALRAGIGAALIPNVMDFENPPEDMDDYSSDVRGTLGIKDKQVLLLQPTRVVRRKGIEHAIEFAARLGRDCVLVISHATDDEGNEYQNRLKDYAGLLDVKALFIDEIISEKRGLTPDGRKVYAISDIYPHADIVTYPSIYEGFGNAFLEAVYYKKPVVVNNYSIYFHDIKPRGFDVIEMDDFVSAATIEHAALMLDDASAREKMAEKNYGLGLRHYSYEILEEALHQLLTILFGARCF